jgi:hypothetical protein
VVDTFLVLLSRDDIKQSNSQKDLYGKEIEMENSKSVTDKLKGQTAGKW